MVKVAKPLDDLLEKEWDYQLFNSKKGLAPSTGWRLVYHTMRSKGSRSGFPDRVLIRDRVIFAELKREKTKPTDEQCVWLDGLARAGAETYLWIPSDLEEAGRILGPRWGFQGWTTDRPPQLIHYAQGCWTPRSAWVPGVGRAELLGSAGV